MTLRRLHHDFDSYTQHSSVYRVIFHLPAAVSAASHAGSLIRSNGTIDLTTSDVSVEALYEILRRYVDFSSIPADQPQDLGFVIAGRPVPASPVIRISSLVSEGQPLRVFSYILRRAREHERTVEPSSDDEEPSTRGLNRLLGMGFSPNEVESYRSLMRRNARARAAGRRGRSGQLAIEEAFFEDHQSPHQPPTQNEEIPYRYRRRVFDASASNRGFWRGLPPSTHTSSWLPSDGSDDEDPIAQSLRVVWSDWRLLVRLALTIFGFFLGPVAFLTILAGSRLNPALLALLVGGALNILHAGLLLSDRSDVSEG